MSRTIVVTGGAGFIGSAVCRRMHALTDFRIVNVDNLTYAGNLASLAEIPEGPRYAFVQADICDRAAMDNVLKTFTPDAIMHLAAESHVDRSIAGSAPFIHTNIVGTHVLLEASLAHFRTLSGAARDRFRFLAISTDEVFGSLGPEGFFSETTPFDPRSPYSASKAASDHLVSAWGHTYQLPVLISNCSNNYGPYQFPEKLIPLMILNAVHGKPLPVYGDGLNRRDWLFVDDHVDALMTILEKGVPGETYCIGGRSERTNIDIVKSICALVDRLAPAANGKSASELLTYVEDRPGHDRRYAIDCSKIERELGWSPAVTFEDGLLQTVEWYLRRSDWWEPIRKGSYRGERLGLVGDAPKA